MIHLNGISKQFGSKVLFESAEAHLSHRSRVALIGPNGAGKSTLIKMILGYESADSGQITRAQHLAIGHLAQEVPKFEGRTVLTEVMRLDGRREDLLQAKDELETEMSQGIECEATLERYGRVLEELEGLDEYRLESRAKEILMGIGFKISDFDRSLTEFSGGWLMRVALSRILLLDPDLLLLDEPTNHLDLESLIWLEEFLKSHQGAMLLVSHDTSFLNRIVTEVLEVDQKKIWSYRGNLDAYALQKEERLTVLRSQYQGQQSKIAEIEKFVARFGAKATKARQAQSRLKQLEKMDRIELPDARPSVRFRFPPSPHSGKEVVTVQHASLSFGSKPLFRDLNWVVRRGSRIAIVGVNGAGKTTLLKLLGGQIDPTEGEFRLGHEVKVGYYAQLQAETLNMNKTVVQELEATAPEMPISQVRAIAGAFLFSGGAADKKCGVLSGGEKARVALAKLLLSPSNFLILDEPTNHLDIESKGMLLEALQDYEGTLCLVSHDRSFVSSLVDSVLEIIPSENKNQHGSEVVQLLGSYDEYLERKTREVTQRKPFENKPQSKSQSPVAQLVDTASPVAPSHNQKRSWERKKEALEIEISQIETRQSEIQTLLALPTTYDDKPTSIRLLEEQRQNEKKLAQKLTSWEELCHLLG